MDQLPTKLPAPLQEIAKENPLLRGKSFAECLEEKEEPKEDEAPLMDGPVSILFMQTPPALPPVQIIRTAEVLVPPIQATLHNGIVNMSVTIQDPTFGTIEVLIDHYDTAPHSFNITFQSNEAAQKAMVSHQKELIAALTKALPGFHFTILPPTYPTAKNSLEKSSRFRYGAKKPPKVYE